LRGGDGDVDDVRKALIAFRAACILVAERFDALEQAQAGLDAAQRNYAQALSEKGRAQEALDRAAGELP
jgi:exonuclease VII small subunit